MEKEYYIGYIENPKKDPNFDTFQQPKIKVILEKENNEYREFLTKSKLFVKTEAMFDGHKLYEENASIYGNVYEKISYDEVKEFLKKLSNTKAREYLEALVDLQIETLKQVLEGEKKYIESTKRFINTFNQPEKKVI